MPSSSNICYTYTEVDSVLTHLLLLPRADAQEDLRFRLPDTVKGKKVLVLYVTCVTRARVGITYAAVFSSAASPSSDASRTQHCRFGMLDAGRRTRVVFAPLPRRTSAARSHAPFVSAPVAADGDHAILGMLGIELGPSPHLHTTHVGRLANPSCPHLLLWMSVAPSLAY